MSKRFCFAGAWVGLCAVFGVGLAAVPAASLAVPNRPPVTTLGVISQLRGRAGCVADRTARQPGCAPVRALRGPGAFLGSEAIAVSSDGRNVYVASASSNALTVFTRNPSTGALTQAAGAAGCVAVGRANGCGFAFGLLNPNSVAISADGRNVYATAFKSNSVVSFQRNPSTGALTQTGCISAVTTPRCTVGRALRGADVVQVSRDGKSVYVGAFTGNAVAIFARSTSSGALSQPGGAGGCIAAGGAGGCATGNAMLNPEGLAVSGDSKNVYVAAPGSGALDVLTRNTSTGALTQPTGGSGCFTNSPLAGCTTGRQLDAADAVTVSPDGKSVYVTTLLSRSVANFVRNTSNGHLTQPTGTTGCAIYVLAVACTLGRALQSPEGLVVSPDGANVYAVSVQPGSIDVFDRTASTSGLLEKPRRPGCFVSRPQPDCTIGRAIRGVTSVAVSPDGRNVYTAAFLSNAVDVFKRVTK
jgi:DNA-binding beta-propeller fold protein YncE